MRPVDSADGWNLPFRVSEDSEVDPQRIRQLLMCSRSGRLFRRVVVQVLTKPSLDLLHLHRLASGIVSDLVPVDLAEAEISRSRVSEIESTHARAWPHRK